ncbi:odorant receptor 4-like [Calliopsis andreniformis]|uniref:odorant receptor 4-like n=1 Tax=Calliopsis andreniformis TaxID=337506 RepID=UPI003FCC7834
MYVRSIYDQNDYEPQNENYEKDIIYIVKHSKWILSSLGIWPVMSQGAKRFFPNVAIGLGNSVLLFAIVPCTLHIIYEQKDIIVRLHLLGLLSFCLIAFIKYGALVARRRKIKECIEHVQYDWRQVELHSDREFMLKYGKVSRNLTIICAVFMYTSGIIYHTILQYAIGTFVDERNRTIKPLVYPTYSVLYNAQRTPIYEIVYVVHCMCGYVMYSVTVGACGLAALFAMHICGQIDIVVTRLEDLVNYRWNSDLTMRLIEIVERHLRTLRFSASVETILQEVCLFEFIGSTFMICLLEYFVIQGLEENNTVSITTYILLLISLTFNIFILCYIGEFLMQKTSDIGLLCFMIDWYYLPTKTIQDLILIIAMSNNPAKISAGKIATLNFSSFGHIIKTSLAYLSFLRTAV